MQGGHDPWTVTVENFPAGGSTAEQLRFLVTYATLAPSSHNSQPWLFRLGEAHVDLLADRTRRLPVVDPDDRELTISCGAALFLLRLALRRFGFTDAVEPFPDPQAPDLLARILVGPGGEASLEERTLFQAIPERRTNRAPFAERPVPDALLAACNEAVRAEGAWLRVVADEAVRGAVADLIAEGDRRQWADPRFRRELAAWLRPNHSPSRDGIPGYALGEKDLESLAAPLLIRTFDLGRGRAAADRQLAAGSPVLAVLGTDQDTPRDRLRAGQAVGRLLLRARVDGVSASFLNQPIEVAELRPELGQVIGHAGWPQLVLRLGYGPDRPHTPRRPVADVLVA